MKYKCIQCGGSGIDIISAGRWDYCKKCLGVGKVNWLENIFEKHEPLTVKEYEKRSKNVNYHLISIGFFKQ